MKIIVVLTISFSSIFINAQSLRFGGGLEVNTIKVKRNNENSSFRMESLTLNLYLTLIATETFAIESRVGISPGQSYYYDGVEYGAFIKQCFLKNTYFNSGVLFHRNFSKSHNSGSINSKAFPSLACGLGYSILGNNLEGPFMVELMYLYTGGAEVGSYNYDIPGEFVKSPIELNGVIKFGVSFNF